jgi:hypothetical protein
MSSIAVFLVLGGATALAAGQLGKNTVGTKQLKKNSVTAAKIKNGAVTGAKVANGSLTGAQINASTLGTVPNATNATNANSAKNADKAKNADNATNANHADSATTAGTAFSQNSGTSILPFNGSSNVQTTVLTLNVPAGVYVIWGKVLGNNNSVATTLANCQLEAGGAVIDNGFDTFRLGPESENDRGYAPVGGVASLPAGGAIEIKCRAGSTEGNWLNRVLTATQVNALG